MEQSFDIRELNEKIEEVKAGDEEPEDSAGETGQETDEEGKDEEGVGAVSCAAAAEPDKGEKKDEYIEE